MGARRLNIGLLVSNIEDDFDNAITEGVIQGAKETDNNLIIVPGHYISHEFFDKTISVNQYQYNSLFSYVNNNNIDILLVLLGTIATTLSNEDKRRFLRMYDGIPTTLLASDLEGFSSVNFDNTAGLKEGIIDLIENNHCKHICMVSGPITNVDALERLNVYKECLATYGLECSENQIVYGNFSPYCEKEVEELLLRNPDVDGIVFANDAMVIGGYDIIKGMGKTIGEDIYVMGFDDSPTAMTLIPHLTSVRADASLLGKIAVYESVKNYSSNEVFNKKVKTNLVKRSSTGYNDSASVRNLYSEEFESLMKNDRRKAAKIIFESFSGDNIYSTSEDYYEQYAIDFFAGYLEQIYDNSDRRVLSGVRTSMEAVFTTNYGKRIDYKRCLHIAEFCKMISIKCYPDREAFIDAVVFAYLAHASKLVAVKINKEYNELNNHMYISNCISRDVLYFDDEEDKAYSSVLDKIFYLGYQGAMIYALDTPYIVKPEFKCCDWKKPDTMLLKSYFFDRNGVISVDSVKQAISNDLLFKNEYMPTDRRYTILVDLMYSHDEQLGIVLCEVEHYQLKFMYTLMAQISSACKHLSTYKAYKDVQIKLQEALKEIGEANKELATISVTDELTGILNRRGFFDRIKELLNIEDNNKRKCAMIFSDLDNLKIINDKFGHDDGDCAIRNAAKILKNLVGEDGVASRIGGDEFAAFMFVDEENEKAIYSKIEEGCNQYNSSSGKDYFVELSTGCVIFENDDSVDVIKKLDEADDILYMHKREKRKSILR